ncbi:MAG TPA: 30S ribosomal protein S9 [Candidatus Nanoarchaeia archaeon]|nr:30S ribosomal protein S9 [Candidatus Nanoarchaeia archaeon]
MAEKIHPIISGKRKTAVARLRLSQGKGVVFYNGLPSTELPLFHKLALAEPLRIYAQELGEDIQFNFIITTRGGGKESQIQAARLALAKALVTITSSDTLKKAYISYDRNMLVPDARRKEANKPGDSAPRAKRQKSYR